MIPSFAPEYPSNLAMIHDRPPLLFVRGQLKESDAKAVAIVGTRNASDGGKELAARLASELARNGITIVSGLAKGIDTAAHSAALNSGGRTIAVFGTSIDTVYPTENARLALAISERGACVSQFLPTMRTGRWCFPARNITTSGLSLGTIVIEAGPTSGAKMQAEAALAHGKRVFLVSELTRHQAWAKEMANHPRVSEASDISTITDAIYSELAQPDGVTV